MTEKRNATVLGVYEELTFKDSHMVADDTFQSLKYVELLEQGYKPAGMITKDSTQEDIDQIVQDVAEKITPPEEDPIWEALAREVYVGMSPRNRCVTITRNRELVEKFEADLERHITNGGDEDEFCLAYLDEMLKDFGWEGDNLEEEARRHEL